MNFFNLSRLKFSTNIIKNITNTNIFEKKFISKNVYNKFFICNTINKDSLIEYNSVYIMEDTFNTFHISELDCKKFVFNNNKTFLGYSFLGGSYNFINKYNKSISFDSFIIKGCQSQLRRSVPESLKLSLQSLHTPFKRKFKNSFLLSANKGGFTIYCMGFIGFLPRSHFLRFFKKMTRRVRKKINNSKSLSIIKSQDITLKVLNFLLSKKNLIKTFFLVRLPFFLGSFKVLPGFIKRNYTKTKKRRRKIFFTNLNFVFLSFKKKKKWRKKKKF